MKSFKKEKKLMAVQGDLAQRIIGIANRKGRTVYSFVNEILEQAIEADEMNRSLKQIVELYKLIEIERKSGAVITTRDIMSYLIKKLYPLEKDALLEKWHSSGQWYGKYLLVRFQDGEPLEVLEKLLHALAWDKSEVRVLRKEKSICLSCVAPERSPEYTELFSRFLEGVMHSLGYKMMKKDLLKGLILLDFTKQE